MKNILRKFTIVVAALISLSNYAFAAETYKIDPMHTYVLWHVTHFGFSNQVGKFTNIEGTLVLDQATPKNSKVDVMIHTADMASGIPKLDDHLKSDEFFDVEKYPTATFVSNKVTVTGKNTAKVEGILTLHGISKPVTLNVTLMKSGIHPMANKKSVGFSASTTIKRSDFGINAYPVALSDAVQLDIGAEANLAS